MFPTHMQVTFGYVVRRAVNLPTVKQAGVGNTTEESTWGSC